MESKIWNLEREVVKLKSQIFKEGRIRYVKRFTGTKKEVNYVVVLQQFRDERWHDIKSEDAQWETLKDEQSYNKANDYEFLHSR